MIYKHYWVLISIYAGARDRMARDAARREQRGKEDNEGGGAPRGTAAGIHRGRTGRRRTSRATNQPFWTNYEWYIRCARLIYAYLPSVPPSRSRGTAASENPTVLCIQTRTRSAACALKNHTPRISAFSTRRVRFDAFRASKISVARSPIHVYIYIRTGRSFGSLRGFVVPRRVVILSSLAFAYSRIVSTKKSTANWKVRLIYYVWSPHCVYREKIFFTQNGQQRKGKRIFRNSSICHVNMKQFPWILQYKTRNLI